MTEKLGKRFIEWLRKECAEAEAEFEKEKEECEKIKDTEYIECRDERGKLIGIRTEYGIEEVPDDYEVNKKLDNIEKKIDKLIADIKILNSLLAFEEK